MNRRLSIFTVVLLFAVSLQAQVDVGDKHYELRNEGHEGPVADATEIDLAIEAYRKAMDADKSALEPRWKLVRALRFKGAYAVSGNEAKRKIFAQAKEISAESIRRLERVMTRKGVKSFEKGNDEQIAKALEGTPDAADVVYWDSVAWGEWALVFGKLAAVRKGAAERIRKSSTVTMLLDPTLDGGGGARVLGRLHNQTPRVPFLTGWASDKLAVRFLRESLSRDATNKLTKVYLAEAMVSYDSDTRPSAVNLCREVINSPNDVTMIVQNLSAQEDAIALLKKWGID